MATIGLRLTNTGNLVIPLGYTVDEITLQSISIQSTVLYTSGIDEITLAGGSIPGRFTKQGNIQLSGILDEITGIN